MRKFTREEKAQIVREYESGMLIEELRTQHKCAKRTIRKILNGANVIIRRKNWHTQIPFTTVLWGEKNPSWRGGVRIARGRRFILNRNHPYAGKDGYVAENRLVMEKMLGRFLLPEEVVHHKNQDISDNRVGNLMLFLSIGAHTTHHARMRKLKID